MNCPKCHRPCYRGIVRQVEPTECSLDNGTACRAYRHGLEVGRRSPISDATAVEAFVAGFVTRMDADGTYRGDHIVEELTAAAKALRTIEERKARR